MNINECFILKLKAGFILANVYPLHSKTFGPSYQKTPHLDASRPQNAPRVEGGRSLREWNDLWNALHLWGRSRGFLERSTWICGSQPHWEQNGRQDRQFNKWMISWYFQVFEAWVGSDHVFLVDKEIVCQYNSVSEFYRWLVCLMIYRGLIFLFGSCLRIHAMYMYIYIYKFKIHRIANICNLLQHSFIFIKALEA